MLQVIGQSDNLFIFCFGVYFTLGVIMPIKYPTITIGELKELLASYPDNFTIDFGGLEFYRLKQRADTHVQMEFSQSVYLDEARNVVVENH